MAGLADLREITAEDRTFGGQFDLYRWGGVDAVYAFGTCPLCSCPKSANVIEANPKEECCSDYGCECHDEERP